MQPQLNTPAWEKIFNSAAVTSHEISRENVAEIIAIMEPGHETDPEACALFCSLGYMGLFQLTDGRFMTLIFECDGSPSLYRQPVTVSTDKELLIRNAFSPNDRALLDIRIPEDEEYPWAAVWQEMGGASLPR